MYIYIYIYICVCVCVCVCVCNKNLANYDSFNPNHKPTARTFFYPVKSLSTIKQNSRKV